MNSNLRVSSEDLDDTYEIDEDDWYQREIEAVYYETMLNQAVNGFYTPSIADQLQNLGTEASMIGTRLSFRWANPIQMSLVQIHLI